MTDYRARRGIRDLWNAWMVDGAEFSALDYPRFPRVGATIPKAVISWPRAKTLHKRMMAKGMADYHINAVIHLFSDDANFDGPISGIWSRRGAKYLLKVVRHFDGVMGLDFTIEPCMPRPIWQHQLYKMRAMEYWLASNGVSVIQNARWCSRSTWDESFDALEEGGTYSLGTVASGLRYLENRPQFENGLRELVIRKHPVALVVVGSADYPIFDEVRKMGVKIIQYDSETCLAFQARKEKGGSHE